MKITEELKFIFGNRLKKMNPGHHTNFVLVDRRSFVEEIGRRIEMCDWCKKKLLHNFVFGSGSNTLVSDAVDGLDKMSMRDFD